MPAPFNPAKKYRNRFQPIPWAALFMSPKNFCVEGLPPGVKHPEARKLCNLVVETPACMIEATSRIFYSRPLDWNFTRLVEAVDMDGVGKVDGCQKNPAPDYTQTLLKAGTFVAAHSLSQTL